MPDTDTNLDPSPPAPETPEAEVAPDHTPVADGVIVDSGPAAVEQPAPEEPAPSKPEEPTPSKPAKAPRAAAKAPQPDEPPPAPAPAKDPGNKRWYVVKVQSGREESIKESIERRVKIEGLEEFFGEIYIPVENVTEMRNNKRVVKEKKLFPGYLMVEVEYNDRILYLFRETSGVGDFVGGSVQHPPVPMSNEEVLRMKGRGGVTVAGIKAPKPKVDRGDRVKVKEGMFVGMEGEVKEILEAKGMVKVELPIFGRPVSVELEYWQVDPA